MLCPRFSTLTTLSSPGEFIDRRSYRSDCSFVPPIVQRFRRRERHRGRHLLRGRRPKARRHRPRHIPQASPQSLQRTIYAQSNYAEMSTESRPRSRRCQMKLIVELVFKLPHASRVWSSRSRRARAAPPFARVLETKTFDATLVGNKKSCTLLWHTLDFWKPHSLLQI